MSAMRRSTFWLQRLPIVPTIEVEITIASAADIPAGDRYNRHDNGPTAHTQQAGERPGEDSHLDESDEHPQVVSPRPPGAPSPRNLRIAGARSNAMNRTASARRGSTGTPERRTERGRTKCER
jgi:hypothetical protein